MTQQTSTTDQLLIHVTMPVQEPQGHLVPLTAQQLRTVGLDQPPPVTYDDLSQLNSGRGYGGYCSFHPNYPQTNGGEVVLDQGLTSLIKSERKRARNLALVYLHEVCHRLTQEAHTPVFAALCLTLTARYEGDLHAASTSLDLYNLWETDPDLRAEAFAFALRFAHTHMHSDTLARALVDLARAEWTDHLEHHSAKAYAQRQREQYMEQFQQLRQVREQLQWSRLERLQHDLTLQQLRAQHKQTTQRLQQARAQTRLERERNRWLMRGYQLLAVLGIITALAVM